MGVGTIKMDKISEIKGVPLYKISTDDYESRDFYVEVDSDERQLRFYFSDIPSNPEYVLNCDDEGHVIVPIKQVHERAFFGALSKLLKALNSKEFPEKMSYSA